MEEGSPTKKAFQPEAPPSMEDPTSPRGSFARQASVGEDVSNRIRESSMRARQHVNTGYQSPTKGTTASSSRRPLGPTQSAPQLFPDHPPIFQSARQVNEVVFDRAGSRDWELQPFGAGGSEPFGSPSRQAVASSTDGFDMDDVHGPSSSLFEQMNNTTPSKKRGHEQPFPVRELEDEEMVQTDPESEGEEEAGDASKRPVKGLRRGLDKTQSLPSTSASFAMDADF